MIVKWFVELSPLVAVACRPVVIAIIIRHVSIIVIKVQHACMYDSIAIVGRIKNKTKQKKKKKGGRNWEDIPQATTMVSNSENMKTEIYERYPMSNRCSPKKLPKCSL